MYRRKLEEIFARYKREPLIFDIFVEGVTDIPFYNWILLENGVTNHKCYTIDSIDIPVENLVQAGIQNSHRGRLIYLAKMLESELSNTKTKVVCIIDRDFDSVLGFNHSGRHILVTDHSSLELYMFNRRTLGKFMRLVAGIDSDYEKVAPEMLQILKDVFCIRAAGIKLNLNMQWVSFEDCCNLSGDEVRFDRQLFIKKLLEKNGLVAKKDEILSCIDQLKGISLKDPLQCIRGHDFISFLAWYLRKRSPALREFSNSSILSRAFLGCIELTDVIDKELVTTLLGRQKNSA